jgi:hypothetical protein
MDREGFRCCTERRRLTSSMSVVPPSSSHSSSTRAATPTQAAAAAAAAAVLLAVVGGVGSLPTFSQSFEPRAAFVSSTRPSPVSSCEAPSRPPGPDLHPETRNDTTPAASTPKTVSWWHRALYQLSIRRRSLPLPRRIGPNDPDLVLTRRQRRQRQRDEQQARALQQRLVQLVQQKQQRQHQNALKHDELDLQLAQLIQELYGVLYGDGVTPQSRQEFLERHGCTGWTEHAMDAILRRAGMRGRRGSDDHNEETKWQPHQQLPRGVVEIGAGHGQWAREIADRYQRLRLDANSLVPSKPFDIVLAYDDRSSLPLNANVYHSQTRPHRSYFYDRVQPCPSIQAVLSQWQCRGRVLLLVYPPPDSDMARDALQVYADVNDGSATVVYVGEGRGGANANDAFFDLLEASDAQWILEEIVNVQPMGSKGYERMFVFTRSKSRLAAESAR